MKISYEFAFHITGVTLLSICIYSLEVILYVEAHHPLFYFCIYREDAEKMAALASADKGFQQNSEKPRPLSSQATNSSGK